jgi:hypothetical protein
MSKRNHSWQSVGGPDTLFLATSTASVGAFEPFEDRLEQRVGSQRVQTTFRSVSASRRLISSCYAAAQ